MQTKSKGIPVAFYYYFYLFGVRVIQNATVGFCTHHYPILSRTCTERTNSRQTASDLEMRRHRKFARHIQSNLIVYAYSTYTIHSRILFCSVWLDKSIWCQHNHNSNTSISTTHSAKRHLSNNIPFISPTDTLTPVFAARIRLGLPTAACKRLPSLQSFRNAKISVKILHTHARSTM